MISKLINREKMETAVEKGKYGNCGFNCWGTTLYTLDQVDRLYWASVEDITEFINNNTMEVIGEDSVKSGDIVVMYEYADEFYTNQLTESELETLNKDGEWIIHTAVFITKTKLFHKCGGGRSEFTDLEGVLDSYSYDRFEIRRMDTYKK